MMVVTSWQPHHGLDAGSAPVKVPPRRLSQAGNILPPPDIELPTTIEGAVLSCAARYGLALGHRREVDR